MLSKEEIGPKLSDLQDKFHKLIQEVGEVEKLSRSQILEKLQNATRCLTKGGMDILDKYTPLQPSEKQRSWLQELVQCFAEKVTTDLKTTEGYPKKVTSFRNTSLVPFKAEIDAWPTDSLSRSDMKDFKGLQGTLEDWQTRIDNMSQPLNEIKAAKAHIKERSAILKRGAVELNDNAFATSYTRAQFTVDIMNLYSEAQIEYDFETWIRGFTHCVHTSVKDGELSGEEHVKAQAEALMETTLKFRSIEPIGRWKMNVEELLGERSPRSSQGRR